MTRKGAPKHGGRNVLANDLLFYYNVLSELEAQPYPLLPLGSGFMSV